MAEDNKTMANEELGSLFSSNMMSIAPNVITSLSADNAPIPSIENVTDAAQSVINNNVNLSLNIANAGQNITKNYNTIGKEISNFLNTEKISDPLDLKKNYQTNLKIENTNLLSSNSINPIDNISLISSSTSSPISNITNSNITNLNSNLYQTPSSMESFEKNISIQNQNSNNTFSSPIVQNISNQQIPELSSGDVSFQSSNIQNVTNNSVSDLTNRTDSSFVQSTNNTYYQPITNNNTSVYNSSNSTNFMSSDNVTNNTNVASMSRNSQQQFVGNYSTVVVENRATYKPLERMDANPNPQFSNGQRDIINTSPSEKVHSIETRLMELERIEGENRDLNNEKTNSIQNYNMLDAVVNSPMFEKLTDSTSLHRTANVNKSSMSANTIGILINKMNSPPIWRTVLG